MRDLINTSRQRQSTPDLEVAHTCALPTQPRTHARAHTHTPLCQCQSFLAALVSVFKRKWLAHGCARARKLVHLSQQAPHFFLFLTSSHLMNLPPFFSASWTDTGLSCSAWTPGLAPAMARGGGECSHPRCQRLKPGYEASWNSSEGGEKHSSVLRFQPRGSCVLLSGERAR